MPDAKPANDEVRLATRAAVLEALDECAASTATPRAAFEDALSLLRAGFEAATEFERQSMHASLRMHADGSLVAYALAEELFQSATRPAREAFLAQAAVLLSGYEREIAPATDKRDAAIKSALAAEDAAAKAEPVVLAEAAVAVEARR